MNARQVLKDEANVFGEASHYGVGAKARSITTRDGVFIDKAPLSFQIRKNKSLQLALASFLEDVWSSAKLGNECATFGEGERRGEVGEVRGKDSLVGGFGCGKFASTTKPPQGLYPSVSSFWHDALRVILPLCNLALILQSPFSDPFALVA